MAVNRRPAALLVGVLGLAFLVGAVASVRAERKTHVITIEDMRFQPDVLVVALGDTITWVNKDLVPHTATSKTAGFDSKAIQAGASWRHTVRTEGDVVYTCAFHPTMIGRLRVITGARR